MCTHFSKNKTREFMIHCLVQAQIYCVVCAFLEREREREREIDFIFIEIMNKNII